MILIPCIFYFFKPDKENQDFLFDRISESYVRLFVSIPVSRKDAFFQVNIEINYYANIFRSNEIENSYFIYSSHSRMFYSLD